MSRMVGGFSLAHESPIGAWFPQNTQVTRVCMTFISFVSYFLSYKSPPHV